ncbi:hypothetical protein TBK1r_45990 [Stieleria magnilauensis]|uniref:Uncharacterized protein n=2 Tax=Stieleria magnilauensis TaxID=2527963 RepID=A0ABX5XXB1_9BACT|nr:hypothetical protein TBK1r_45990 [Planctomycetes bacterium TBK1r]
MGENVMKGQVDRFQKMKDLAFNNFCAETLFERPEVFLTDYQACPVDEAAVAVGDVLMAHVAADGETVILSIADDVVGKMDGESASELIETMANSECPEMATLKVVAVSEISGFWTLRLPRSGDGHG